MLALNYFWFYIIAHFFSFLMLRCSQRGMIHGAGTVSDLLNIAVSGLGALCTLALGVFIILGFWFMPQWWYPIVFFLCNFVVAWIPIPDRLGAIVGIIVAPVFTVLAYLGMFGVL